MRIIIAGDGKVGLALTRLLSQEGHDLVTIDSNRAVLERDMQQFDVMTVVGNCATMATLNEAKVQQAEVLIAATSADEINLLCCLTARKMNPTLHTIARVRSPEYREQLYMMRGEFGLSLIINPEREAAKEIFRLLQLPGFLKRETFAKGRVEIVELRVLERSPLENVASSGTSGTTEALSLLYIGPERQRSQSRLRPNLSYSLIYHSAGMERRRLASEMLDCRISSISANST